MKARPTMRACNPIGIGVCLALAAGLAAGRAYADSLPQSVIDAQYARISPALCIVSYASEITNERTGDTNKRQTRAMGVIVSPEGLVIGPGHMQLDYSKPLNVRISVGQGDAEKEYPAEVLTKPEDVNLCFMRIKPETPEKFPYVRFAPNARLSIGEPLMVLGLFGENLDFAHAAQFRSIGAILEKPRTTYCLDEPVPLGFVAGPVVNAQGEAVGVIGLDLSPQEGGELYTHGGHPLVYQTSLFQHYIEQPPGLQEEQTNAWIGVFSQPLSDDLAEYWGLPKEGGVVVSTVVPDAPAAKAGIQRGDIIIEFNNTPIHSKLDRDIAGFTKLVRECQPGQEISIRLLRNETPMDVKATLTELPKSGKEAGEYEDSVFGFTVQELTRDLRIRLNLDEDLQGVIVFRVKSGSDAQLAGFRPGVIILRFGEHPIASIDDFKAAVEKVAADKPGEIPIFCRVGPRTGFFRLIPNWNRGEEG